MSVTQPPSTSSSILDRAKLHDEEAWRKLTAIYGPIVYYWTRKAGLQPGDAADVVQEVFLAVLLHLDRYRPRDPTGNFRGWLRSIYHSKLMDHFRRNNIEPPAAGGSTFESMVQAAAGASSTNEDVDETSRLLYRALRMIQDDFEGRTWDAFWRSTVLGERTRDVASALEMTPAAVCMSRSRVLRRLRETLKGLGLVPDD